MATSVIVGGSSGLGRVIAQRLADRGDRSGPTPTIVTAFNGGVSGLVKTLAVEIAPHRVNALHPGVVGDSPKWSAVTDHPHVARTPIGRLVTMDEIADATEFLLRNAGVNAHDLFVDGGLLVT